MKSIKMVVNEMFIISTCMMIGLGIQEVLIHFSSGMSTFEMPWYIPLTIPFTAFVCSLPSALLNECDGLNKKQIVVRVILHYFCLLFVVTSCGYMFHWYSQVLEYLVIACVYTIIYGVVWLISWWLNKRDEDTINKALKIIQDKE
ncbi:MAG: DUF3021 family protein [Clostridiales bacterium]|nr:DUF3021 family protein [Clostridiales bacterium]